MSACICLRKVLMTASFTVSGTSPLYSIGDNMLMRVVWLRFYPARSGLVQRKVGVKTDAFFSKAGVNTDVFFSNAGVNTDAFFS